MSDPALKGNCLSCGKQTYAQAHCDDCSSFDGKYFCPECENDVETPNGKQPKDCIDHVDLNVLLEICESDDTPHERMYRAMNRLHDAIKAKRLVTFDKIKVQELLRADQAFFNEGCNGKLDK